jgi:Ca2+-transporting ATPase
MITQHPPLHSQTVWHGVPQAELPQALAVDPTQGLDGREADRRLAQVGANQLAEAQPRPVFLKFLDQFRNVLVIVLLFAAIMALLIGDIKDALVILVVVLVNASLGFYQEYRAEKTLAALKGMLAQRATVRRNGQVQEVDATVLVPGDIVLLGAGSHIPADGRLLVAHNLEVEESALTGESQVVGKSVVELAASDLALGDRINMLYMNTTVVRGRAELLVTTTGMHTEMGRLASMIAAAQENETPLQRQLDTLGKKLAAIAAVIITLIFTLDFMRGLPWAQAAMTAVALAVAAIPEGLPAVVTVTLAIGMWRMAQNRAILKKLAAVETLGSTTVICSDKTGAVGGGAAVHRQRRGLPTARQHLPSSFTPYPLPEGEGAKCGRGAGGEGVLNSQPNRLKRTPAAHGVVHRIPRARRRTDRQSYRRRIMGAGAERRAGPRA